MTPLTTAQNCGMDNGAPFAGVNDTSDPFDNKAAVNEMSASWSITESMPSVRLNVVPVTPLGAT